MSGYEDDRLAGYVDVATRIAEFRAKHPAGCLQPADHDVPFKIIELGEVRFLAYIAAAYRHPEDTRPGIGMAWEPLPGRTPYTRGSELQNAETSAWGRAIVAALAADTRTGIGIATADEVRNRIADEEASRPAQRSKPKTPPTDEWQLPADATASQLRTLIGKHLKRLGWTREQAEAAFAEQNGGLTLGAAEPAELSAFIGWLGKQEINPGPPKITAAQRSKLQAQLNAAGIRDRDKRLAWISAQVGRDVHSSNDLTTAEAGRLIEMLTAPADKEEQPS